jgi:hypothetical protein
VYDQETGKFELEKDKPLVLLLGGIAREGVFSALQTSGRQYKMKDLESSPKNWETILQLFDDFTIECVLMKLSTRTISLMASSEYYVVRESLFSKIGGVPNIVFVFEKVLSGDFNAIEWAEWQDQPTDESCNAAISLLEKHKIRVMPYRRNAELTTMAASFLDETEKHLVFRLYVPQGRIWSNETDKLLQLFREYLAKVAAITVRLDQYRTDRGVIYEFRSEKSTSTTSIRNEFSDFTRFMDLCTSDREAAELILKNKEVDPKEVMAILSRYSKEAKRLSVDLKHEREQKVLNIRQRLESELIDSISGDMNWASISSLVDLAVPQVDNVFGAIALDQESKRVSEHLSNLPISICNQIVDKINGVVAQEISGYEKVSPEALQLLALVKKYGEVDTQDLTSSVHELEDPNAPKSGRVNAKHNLKKFLFAVSNKIGDVAAGVLQSYIENQLKL